MSLLNLPSELICQIIEQTCPRGYESLMCSCKTLCHIGNAYLERHNRLRRRYRHFQYDSSLDGPILLLMEIAHDPVIADYIEVADLTAFNRAHVQLNSSSREVSAILEHTYDTVALQRLMNKSWLLSSAMVDPRTCFDWNHSHGFIGVSLRATLLLLSLLKNVRRLTLPKAWNHFPPSMGNDESDEREQCWKMLDLIAINACTGKYGERSLATLTRFDPPCVLQDENPVALQKFAPLFLLPSLQQVRASHCVADRKHVSGDPFNWRYSGYACNLQKLQLVSCCVTGREIANLVIHTPNLCSFEFSYASKYYSLGSDWDVGEFITALATHRGNQITKLAVVVDNVYGAVKGGLRSLKKFTRLEHLELDVQFFFGPDETENSRISSLSPAEFRDYAYDMRWNGSLLPNLTQILPPTIRTARLLAGSSNEDILILKGLFSGLGQSSSPPSIPSLYSIRVLRARSILGSQEVKPFHQFAASWKSVGDVVAAAGGDYEEHETVRGSFVDDHDRL